MNAKFAFRILFLICSLGFVFHASGRQEARAQTNWRVYFSPRGGATEAVIDAIDEARSSILVQAYSFTSKTIAEALARAHKRGVHVQVILDKSQRTQKYAVAALLSQASIPILFDAAHAIAHNKVMIIDERFVVTGSYNFTMAAEERNAENLLIVHDRELSAQYVHNWKIHRAHSTIVSRKVALKHRSRPIHRGHLNPQ